MQSTASFRLRACSRASRSKFITISPSLRSTISLENTAWFPMTSPCSFTPCSPPKKTPRRTTHDAVSPGHPRDRNVSTGHLAAGQIMNRGQIGQTAGIRRPCGRCSSRKRSGHCEYAPGRDDGIAHETERITPACPFPLARGPRLGYKPCVPGSGPGVPAAALAERVDPKRSTLQQNARR
jgi:hypothetical protein